ncbi:hypothetical protein GE09DRAFT_5372 [Coniochaeta sp. 2T2.1]|nr:hypothetical protein GE09DRAFT_5372 [Coniochaeta sp. 2T2.1]
MYRAYFHHQCTTTLIDQLQQRNPHWPGPEIFFRPRPVSGPYDLQTEGWWSSLRGSICLSFWPRTFRASLSPRLEDTAWTELRCVGAGLGKMHVLYERCSSLRPGQEGGSVAGASIPHLSSMVDVLGRQQKSETLCICAPRQQRQVQSSQRGMQYYFSTYCPLGTPRPATIWRGHLAAYARSHRLEMAVDTRASLRCKRAVGQLPSSSMVKFPAFDHGALFFFDSPSQLCLMRLCNPPASRDIHTSFDKWDAGDLA